MTFSQPTEYKNDFSRETEYKRAAMKTQSAVIKAFEINKDPGIYGTFAEIGAGQETVNFFYKAGLASQTVAKSMSAYDMTVSDEIYGKQSRYVSKERLLTMLDREYRLLEKRLKKKSGDKSRFFVFAETATTGTQSESLSVSRHRHAWMGLRFQANPLEPPSDIVFHVNCLDNSRLEQHESLGVLGVNLIHAGFHFKNRPKKLISLLTDNLSGYRKVEIQSLSCQGPAFKSLSWTGQDKRAGGGKISTKKEPKTGPLATWLNMEVLRQNLSPLAFFPTEKGSEFFPDAAFGKTPVILYKNKSVIRDFQENRERIFQALSLQPSDRPSDGNHLESATPQNQREQKSPLAFKVFSVFDPKKDQLGRNHIDKAQAPGKQLRLFELAQNPHHRNKRLVFTAEKLLSLCKGPLPLLKVEHFGGTKNHRADGAKGFAVKENTSGKGNTQTSGPPIEPTLKKESTTDKARQTEPLPVFFTPKGLSPAFFHTKLQELCRKGVSVLTASDLPLDNLRELVSLYIKGPLVFVVQADTKLFSPFAQTGGMAPASSKASVEGENLKMKQKKLAWDEGTQSLGEDFDRHPRNEGKAGFAQNAKARECRKSKSLLTFLGALFDKGTKLVVLDRK